MAGQGCSDKAQDSVCVHCTLGNYTLHFCKGFLKLKTVRVFLLQGFSNEILLFCYEPAKSNKIQLPRTQVRGVATETFPGREGSEVQSHGGKEEGNIHINIWRLLEKAMPSHPQNSWRLFTETFLSHEQRVL